ncbi:MAG: cyclic nucleotide-binding domain-containing protein [Anaerolineales bacterium]|jgi:CRP-like cAMP-binding protein
MAISKESKIAFLKQRQLFKGMEDDDFVRIAVRLVEYSVRAGEQFITHGERGRTFYLIFSGRVRVWCREQGSEVELATLQRGDSFGEEALLFNRPRSASVTALEDCVFLTMDIKDFEWMTNTYPDTKTALKINAASYQQARKLRFTWLHSGEVIHLIARRHIAALGFDLAKPMVLFLLAIFFLFFTSYIPGLNTISLIIGLGMVVAGVLWFLWDLYNWMNDYFIITNERIVWLEQVLLQSDSRHEAPMAAIQSVNVETDQTSRIFGYGNVLIRTFTGTGSLRLFNVAQPTQFANLIEELLIRVRSKTEEAHSKLMRQSIRQSLGLDNTHPVDIHSSKGKSDNEEEEEKWVIPLLRTREVKGDVITYHKHWVVLLGKVWLPTLIFTGLVVLTIYLLVQSLAIEDTEIPLLTILFFIGGGMLACLSAIVYHYLDWKNDIYKLTKETIIDSERKPLGRELTKSAPIKNILSIEHSRNGLLHLILDYGIVNVVIADTTLTFFDVHDPAQVQQDIYSRQQQLKREREETEAEQNRVQMSEWLKTYHEIWTKEGQNIPGDEEETENKTAG